MQKSERREALADFLRKRRASLSPAEVGLPPSLRRRTPGLRREEVPRGVGPLREVDDGPPVGSEACLEDDPALEGDGPEGGVGHDRGATAGEFARRCRVD